MDVVTKDSQGDSNKEKIDATVVVDSAAVAADVAADPASIDGHAADAVDSAIADPTGSGKSETSRESEEPEESGDSEESGGAAQSVDVGGEGAANGDGSQPAPVDGSHSSDTVDGGGASDSGDENAASEGFPVWAYVLTFLLVDVLCIAIMQWGVTQDSSTADLSSPIVGFWGMVAKMWTSLNFVFVLNMIMVGVAYLAILMITNRIWVASPIVIVVATIIGVVERFKVQIRYEVINPADFSFLGSDAGNLVSFMPSGAPLVIAGAVAGFAVLTVIFVVIARKDARGGRMIRCENAGLEAVIRLLLIILPIMVVSLHTATVGMVDSVANKVSTAMGDTPSMWDSVYDAQRNGVVVSFLRQLNPKIMDEPSGYSESTMKKIAAKYAKKATSINKTRTSELSNSTVVLILSESLSNPERVPGLSLNKKVIPEIDEIKSSTTSGLMLSSGYGGGTANLEYMGLTGLSMANFASSLTSPYQQLVPTESWTPTFNRIWGSSSNSIAFHPYEPSMYSRESNYVKFGFSKFYTLGSPRIKYTAKLGDSPYVSDESAYKSALEEISSTSNNQFVQIITMQNHMPYHDWYANNEFTVTSTDSSKELGDDETTSIETYAKGASITSKATKKFLDQLDSLDKPVTVVFYGDHLPGIYSTASEDSSNSLALHLTDYFIWSNKASTSSGVKDDDAAYTSPNFFMAQTAEHMNARVSPYLAFLTTLHSKIAAMEPPVVNTIQGWSRIPEGQSLYLNQKSEPLSSVDFDEGTKTLLKDYKLIQYDITAGKGYLRSLGFMTVP